MKPRISGRYVLHLLLIVLILPASFGLTPARAAPPAAPQAIPAQLPVFRMMAPVVDNASSGGLADRLEGLGRTNIISGTTYAGTTRFFVEGSSPGIFLQQFAASGGFFAYNVPEAFSEQDRGMLDPTTAKGNACDFLTRNQLFPHETAPGGMNCKEPQLLPYSITIGNSTVFTPSLNISKTVQTAIIVGVPLAIPYTEQTGAIFNIPLTGPGGHLSLLFTATDPASTNPSLDTAAPGLAGIAEPWYQRGLEPMGTFPVISEQEAIMRFTSGIKGGTVNPGTPELTYYVPDAASPQDLLIPTWTFPNATEDINGELVPLKGTSIPAVDGFLPAVQITAPVTGTVTARGATVDLTATITGGTPPYSYTIGLPGGPALASGSTADGAVSTPVGPLMPDLRPGEPVSYTLQMSVTDSLGAPAAASVELQQAASPFIYIPFIALAGHAAGASTQAPAAAPQRPEAVNYRVSVEWIKNFNGLQNNLSGTQPDADGLWNGLQGYGWGPGVRWTDNAAWEKDWRDCSLGGGDCSYGMDRADFAYISTHGSASRIYFGTTHDYGSFFGGNARFQNIRWAGFSSCNTIRAENISDWFNAFQGASMLLGFYSVMGDVAFGGPLVDNMKIPKFFGLIEIPQWQISIRDAWVKTAFDMDAGRPAYIYAVGTNGVNPANDKLPKGGDPLRARPYPVASWHWVWWYLPGD